MVRVKSAQQPGTFLLAALWCAALCGNVGAARAVEVSYGVDAFSRYVWRGITLSDGPVLQPSVRLSHQLAKRHTLTGMVWGNVDLEDGNDTAGDWNELDLTVDYGFNARRFRLALGLKQYTFPNTGFRNTCEFFVRIEARTLVKPVLTLYYDFGEIDDPYVNLALAIDRTITANWRYRLALSAGYAGSDFAIAGQRGLHDGNLTLELTHERGRLRLGGLVGWTESLDEEVLFTQPAGGWAGVRMSMTF